MVKAVRGAAHSRKCEFGWLREEGPDEITLSKVQVQVQEGLSKEGRAGPAGQLGKRRMVSIRRGQKRGCESRGKSRG